jgi:glutamate N-acetyltransferase / amino-acid N-acetyltransferase
VVDACRSTNDTVLVLANGAASGDNPPIGFGGTPYHAFADALRGVCSSLAQQMAVDAEGATKIAHVHVRGARSDDDARRAARAVAASQLVQCSLYGEDPYWGRVLSELGASGAFIDPDRVDISYNNILVCHDGIAHPHDAVALAEAMADRLIVIDCDLHLGRGEARMSFTDLTHAYVDENRGTS